MFKFKRKILTVFSLLALFFNILLVGTLTVDQVLYSYSYVMAKGVVSPTFLIIRPVKRKRPLIRSFPNLAATLLFSGERYSKDRKDNKHQGKEVTVKFIIPQNVPEPETAD